ncbi:hypothetical protein SCODD09_00942 [Streptococcus constellatus]|nr:hypothetical protein SCODD09_00942 [Streptococcus constellatus]
MIFGNNYSYKELQKINKTLNRIDKRQEQFAELGVKNETELNYVLTNAWKYYLEEVEGEVKIFPKTINFQDDDGQPHVFIIAIDISRAFGTTNLVLRGFNSFTKEWTVDFEDNERSLSHLVWLLESIYLVEINEYLDIFVSIKNKAISYNRFSELFSTSISVYDFINRKARSQGYRFGLQQERYADSESNAELKHRLKTEIQRRHMLINSRHIDNHLEDLEYLQGLYDLMMGYYIPEMFDKLGFYPLSPVSFSEEIPYLPVLFGKKTRKIEAFGYPIVDNEVTNIYLNLTHTILSYYRDIRWVKAFKFKLMV